MFEHFAQAKNHCIFATLSGAIAQLVERFNGIEEVRSSNLLSSTILHSPRIGFYHDELTLLSERQDARQATFT